MLTLQPGGWKWLETEPGRSLQRFAKEKGSSIYSKEHLFTIEGRFLHSECKGLTPVLNPEGASEPPGNLTIHHTSFYWAPTACQAWEHICDWMYVCIFLFPSASQKGIILSLRPRPRSAAGRGWVRWRRKWVRGGEPRHPLLFLAHYSFPLGNIIKSLKGSDSFLSLQMILRIRTL